MKNRKLFFGLAILCLLGYLSSNRLSHSDPLTQLQGGPLRDSLVSLPTPTGPFTVGVTTFYRSDSTRAEEITLDSTDFRQFAASIFYPGTRNNEPPRVYFPDLNQFRAALRATSIPSPRGVDSFSVHFSGVATSVYENIPINKSGGLYPLVLVSSGGNMSRHWYTAMAQELSSHGYVVVVMSHAHSGIDIFPLGGLVRKNDYYDESIPQRNKELTQRIAEDVVFITNRMLKLNSSNSSHFLSGSIDPERIAIVGHSRGARAVNYVLSLDRRFKGGVRLDGLGAPINSSLVLSQPHMTVRGPWINKKRLSKLHQLHSSTQATSYDIVVKGVSHFSFSDLTLVVPKKFDAEIDPLTGHLQISRIVLSFFSAVLGPDNNHPFVLSNLPKLKNVEVSVYRPYR